MRRDLRIRCFEDSDSKVRESSGKTVRNRNVPGGFYAGSNTEDSIHISTWFIKDVIPDNSVPRSCREIIPYINNSHLPGIRLSFFFSSCLDPMYWHELTRWHEKTINSIFDLHPHLLGKVFITHPIHKCKGFFDKYLSVEDMIAFDQVSFGINWETSCMEIDGKKMKWYIENLKSKGHSDLYPTIQEIYEYIRNLKITSIFRKRLIWKSAYCFFNRLLGQSIIYPVALRKFQFLNFSEEELARIQHEEIENPFKFQPQIIFVNYNARKFTGKYILEKYSIQHSPKWRKGFRQKSKCKGFRKQGTCGSSDLPLLYFNINIKNIVK